LQSLRERLVCVHSMVPGAVVRHRVHHHGSPFSLASWAAGMTCGDEQSELIT
jgi:hypothetical protein